MEKILCSLCRCPLIRKANETEIECKICKHKNDLNAAVSLDDMCNEAIEYSSMGDYDIALTKFNAIIEKNPKHYLARWHRLLCKYHIVYVYEAEDENRPFITFRKPLSEVFTGEDEDELKRILEDAKGTSYEASIIRHKKYIEETLKKINSFKDENTYDIFICYKETDPEKTNEKEAYKKRTKDSYYAEMIYHKLSQSGYKVFFSRVTAKSKVGEDYEALIYHAISTAKVMILLGLNKEYFESTWVKSEWKRFLEVSKGDSTKKIIPLFETADDVPVELTRQGMNIEQACENECEDLIAEIYGLLGNADNKESIFRFGISDIQKEEYLKGIEKLEGIEKTGENTALEKEAYQLFKKAAKAGNPDAKYQRGTMKEFGIGTSKSQVMANNYYTEAFEENKKL